MMKSPQANMTTQADQLVFKIDEKLLQRRPPRLTLAGTLSALCEQINSRQLNPNFVVEILNENQLLPYSIRRTKDLFAISLGQNTNASKIGDLIVSEECIKGSYELCISFLEFTLAIISNTSYQDTSKIALASVVYIVNEIYTSHHMWSYKRYDDMLKIQCLCTKIFHHIISNVDEKSDKRQLNELEIVCIVSLSQHQAHKQMLDVIVDDKADMQQEAVVECVRQSLSIFNKLLTLSKFIKDYCPAAVDNSNSPKSIGQEGSSTNSEVPLTNIEKALFDTSIRPGLLQRLFSYVYRKQDSATACITIDLIKNIAKKFSMSLMACLGSEAAKVCEFFIESLDNKDLDIDLEIAILDLLSTCVRHQPGLIELFLNYNLDGNQDNKPTQTATEQTRRSLEVIMNILESCSSRKEDDQKLLHTYIMKFILTFWQKHHSAIEQFDQAKNFWPSITQPLKKFLSDDNQNANKEVPNENVRDLDDELCSYSLMILAREVFCLNAGISERKINPGLRNILDDLSKKNYLGKYSTHLLKKYSKLSETTAKGDHYGRLLVAWRDFMASFVKYTPLEIDSSVQHQIIQDVLEMMRLELRLGKNLDKERMAAIGETILLVWTKWMPSQNKNADENVFNSIHEIIYLTDSCKEHLPYSFLLTFQSTLNIYLVRYREHLLNFKRSFDLLVPAMHLMHFSMKVMEHKRRDWQSSLNYKPCIESRLSLASIMSFKFILDVSRADVSLWLSYLQENLKADAMVQFLTLLMNKRIAPEVCSAIVELLICLSTIAETAQYLNKAGLVEGVNMMSVSAYERPYAHLSQLASLNNTINSNTKQSSVKEQQQSQPQQQPVPMELVGLNNKESANTINDTANLNYPMSETTKIYLENINSDHEWLPIHRYVIRLNISMLLTLGSDYMATAVEFISTHSIRVCDLLELLRTKPRSVDMDEVLQIIYLISLLLRHGSMWHRRNKQSHDAIAEEIAKTAYTLATSALPLPTTSGQAENQLTSHTSMKPRDCLVYAKCCYDFGRYTEAERVLFQTKFGDKSGFIKEAAQIYGEELSEHAFHLAALICKKTNRQTDFIDFAIQVLAGDSNYIDIVSALSQSRAG